MLGASGQSQHQPAQQQQHHQQNNTQHRSLNSPTNQQQQQHHQHQHLVNHRTSHANQKYDEDDPFEDDCGMRVGHNYQAEVPQFIAYAPAPEYYEDEKAIRVWSPYNKIPDHVLDEFICKAKDKFSYNTEQALGMLSWHKFDMNRAYADLANFVPYPNEWSVEDKVLFEQAYQFHEKQFNKIKQMLPDKSMASLINYYYGWKKTRTRASLMERQTRRFAAKRNADSNGPSDDEEAEDENETNVGGNDNGNADQQDHDQKESSSPDEDVVDDPQINCSWCNAELRVQGENMAIIIDAVVDNYCEKCYIEWKSNPGKNKSIKPQVGDCFYSHASDNHKKTILFIYTDVLTIIEGSAEQGDSMLTHLDSQIQDKKREIQTRKQTLSQINEKIQPIADQIADLNMDEFSDILPDYKPSNIWLQDEIQLVIQGLRRYGTDFSAISDIVRTKSPESIKSFFVSQKERLGLGLLADEFDRNKQQSALPQKEKQPA